MKSSVVQSQVHNITSSFVSSSHQSQIDKHENFLVTFMVPYETELGQSVCVVGSIMQLGQWKNFSAHMKWTEGHIWTLPDMRISDKYFQYKYVVLRNGVPERWE